MGSRSAEEKYEFAELFQFGDHYGCDVVDILFRMERALSSNKMRFSDLMTLLRAYVSTASDLYELFEN